MTQLGGKQMLPAYLLVSDMTYNVSFANRYFLPKLQIYEHIVGNGLN